MKHLIDIKDLSVEEIDKMIEVAKDIIANKEKYSNKCDGKMQVIVYQYPTLYMETFIIHRTRDLQ